MYRKMISSCNIEETCSPFWKVIVYICIYVPKKLGKDVSNLKELCEVNALHNQQWVTLIEIAMICCSIMWSVLHSRLWINFKESIMVCCIIMWRVLHSQAPNYPII